MADSIFFISRSIHSGVTSGSIKMDFGRSERIVYKDVIVPAFGRFLHKCYSTSLLSLFHDSAVTPALQLFKSVERKHCQKKVAFWVCRAPNGRIAYNFTLSLKITAQKSKNSSELLLLDMYLLPLQA